MLILLSSPDADQPAYLKALQKYCPYADVRLWQDVRNCDWQAEYALVWKPDNRLFQQQRSLRAIFNLGAGIDALESLPDLPAHTPLYKLRDAGMGAWMLEYVLYGMVHFGRRFDRYQANHSLRVWQPESTVPLSSRTVGIMGLGPLGLYVGQQLHTLGYRVLGWSRKSKKSPFFEQLSGYENLNTFISRSHFLINLLPAKAETYHLLDSERLMRLPRGAVVISVGRGSVIDEHALLIQLQTQHIRGAMLDVFEHEPLACKHPFWQQDNLLITPHIAAPTQHDDAIRQIIADIMDIELGSDDTGIRMCR